PAEPELAAGSGPQRQRRARAVAGPQQYYRPPARMPARTRRCAATGLPGRRRTGPRAIARAKRPDRAGCLFRLSGRVEICRARAGFQRFSCLESATLEFLIRSKFVVHRWRRARLATAAWLTFIYS